MVKETKNIISSIKKRFSAENKVTVRFKLRLNNISNAMASHTICFYTDEAMTRHIPEVLPPWSPTQVYFHKGGGTYDTINHNTPLGTWVDYKLVINGTSYIIKENGNTIVDTTLSAKTVADLKTD